MSSFGACRTLAWVMSTLHRSHVEAVRVAREAKR